MYTKTQQMTAMTKGIKRNKIMKLQKIKREER
jgi:hypothetical protein